MFEKREKRNLTRLQTYDICIRGFKQQVFEHAKGEAINEG